VIKRAFPFISHTLVAGAGWALVMAMRPPLPFAVGNSSGTTEATQAPTKTHIRESWQGEGGRLLRDLLEKREKLEDFRDVPPATDRAAAAMAAIQAWRSDPGNAEFRKEARARLSHWIEADPKAAVAYWNQQPVWPGPPLVEMLASAAANADTATLLACLEPSGGSRHATLDGPRLALLSLLAKSLAGPGSTSQLVDALKLLPPSYGPTLLRLAIQSWPENRLDTLAPLLASSRDTDVVTAYFQRLPGNQQQAWLQARFTGKVPTDPAQIGLFRSLLNRATAMPLQERIQWIARLDQAGGRAAGRATTPDDLLSGDVTDFLNRMNGSEDGLSADWRHRLRHDQISAAEILADVQRAMPDAATREPDQLLRKVFQHVAQHAPEGAMELLGGLPVPEREKQMLDSAFFSGGAANPQALFDLVSTLPPHLGSNANERFKVWLRAANPSVGRFGDSYGEWVLAMPHGVERDMALSALGAHFEANDPKAAAAYRAAKTLPPGWKPER
jgi:hypothetical protein